MNLFLFLGLNVCGTLIALAIVLGVVQYWIVPRLIRAL